MTVDLNLTTYKQHVDVDGRRRHTCTDMTIAGDVLTVTERSTRDVVGLYRVLAVVPGGYTVEDGNGATATMSPVDACSCNCR